MQILFVADTLEFDGENLPVNLDLILEKRSELIRISEEEQKQSSPEEECSVFDPYNVVLVKLPIVDDVDKVEVTCENEKANRLFVKCEI